MNKFSILQKWPEVEKEFLEDKNCNIVVQVNGKKRGIISIEKGLNEELIRDKVTNDEKINKHLSNKKIFKTIYIKDKIINFIIK